MFEPQTDQRREGTRMQEGSKKKKEGNMEEKKEVKEKKRLWDEGVERLREGKKNDSTIVRGKDGMMLQGRS